MRIPSRAGGVLAAVAAAATVLASAARAADPVTLTPLDSLGACPADTSDTPILLIHGTNATLEQSLGPTRQALAADGRCVYGPDYDSTRSLSTSVAYFTAVVDRILAVNHADSIDVVGKSQGGLIARAVSLQFTSRPSNPIRKLVTVSGPHHGVGPNIPGVDVGSAAAPVPGLTPAMRDMLAGSPFLAATDRNGMTAPGVQYTMIGTRYDEIVVPYTSSFVDASGVTNITLQDGCPEDHAGHLAETTDPRAIDLTLHALDPIRHPSIRCTANDNRK